MADQEERVNYSYTGDVDSLRSATYKAIGYLNQYENTIKKMASTDSFAASKTSMVSFQRSINSVTSLVNTLTNTLNKAGANAVRPLQSDIDLVRGAVDTLGAVVELMGESTVTSSKDLQVLTDSLREVKNSIDPVVSRVYAMNTSLKETASLKPLKGFTMGPPPENYQGSSPKPTWSFKVSPEVELAGKSARDSAKAMLELERATLRVTDTKSALALIVNQMNTFKIKASEAWSEFQAKMDPVTVRIESFKAKASSALDTVSKKFNAIKSALRRFQGDTDSASTSQKKQIDITKQQSTALQSLESVLKKVSSGMKSASTSTNLFSKVIGLLASAKIAQIFSQIALQSIKYTENLNLFTVAMGESVDVGKAFIATMQEVYGLDPNNLMRYSGMFYQLADAVDTGSKAAASMSLGLTKAAVDMASLFNVDFETVASNLASGMQGMSRAVRSYGLDIRVTTLQQTALSLGITESVETMNEASRQGLRFITMMKQASNASGDFAKTIETPANQLRIFKEQMSQLGRAIGDLFIGPLGTAVQYLNGFVMALRTIISFIGSVLGLVSSFAPSTIESTDGVAEAVEGIGSAAGGAAAELKKMLAPFDELNVLQSNAGSGGGGGGGLSSTEIMDPAILEAIEKSQWQLESFRMKAVEVRDLILSFLGFKFEDGTIISWDASALETNLIDKFPQWSQTIQSTFDNWTNIVNGFKSVFESMGNVVTRVLEKIKKLLGKVFNDTSVSKWVEDLGGNLESLAAYIDENGESMLAWFLGLKGALAIIPSIASAIGPLITLLSSTGIGAGVGAASGALAGIAGAAAAIAVLYNNSQNFATSIGSLVTTVFGSLSTVASTAASTIQTIWASIQTLYTESIQPALTSIGDFFAQVFGTLEKPIKNVEEILVSALESIEKMWTESVEPALTSIMDGIQSLADVFSNFWEEVVDPVVTKLGEAFVTVWEESIRPVVEKVVSIVGKLVECLMSLWNNVLAPIANWLISVFGPVFSNIFSGVADFVTSAIGNISGIIDGLLTTLGGVIDFVTGVFKGDWETAWNGIKDVFKGIWDAMGDVIKLALNVIIAPINTVLAAISGAINAVINAMNTISVEIPSWVPGLGGKRFGISIPNIDTWQIPYLANGGVVTGPTMAMVGEGMYDEAVIPLGNSPQLQELVNKIAQANERESSVEVRVYIGGEQLEDYNYRVEKRKQLATNGGMR